MAEPIDDAAESLVERLLTALSAQVASHPTAKLTTGAAGALAALTAREAEVLFGSAGHLVHYGSGEDRAAVESLIALVTDLQRSQDHQSKFRPGDHVTLRSDEESAGEPSVFAVRFAGPDGTLLVQPELDLDYVIQTVATEDAAPVGK